MSYNRTPLLDLVDAFEAYVGVVIAGMGTHVVVQDYNLDDANLARALAYLDDEREALLHDPYHDEWIAAALAPRSTSSCSRPGTSWSRACRSFRAGTSRPSASTWRR